jgi:hypothetical protein
MAIQMLKMRISIIKNYCWITNVASVDVDVWLFTWVKVPEKGKNEKHIWLQRSYFHALTFT